MALVFFASGRAGGQCTSGTQCPIPPKAPMQFLFGCLPATRETKTNM